MLIVLLGNWVGLWESLLVIELATYFPKRNLFLFQEDL